MKMKILGCVVIFTIDLVITLSFLWLPIGFWTPLCIILGMGLASFGTTYYHFWMEARRAGMTTRDYILHESRGDI